MLHDRWLLQLNSTIYLYTGFKRTENALMLRCIIIFIYVQVRNTFSHDIARAIYVLNIWRSIAWVLYEDCEQSIQ